MKTRKIKSLSVLERYGLTVSTKTIRDRPSNANMKQEEKRRMSDKISKQEYPQLVKEYRKMFNKTEPALEETGWDIYENMKVLKECIKTKKPYVHEELSFDEIS